MDGNDAFASDQEKKVALTVAHPGEVTAPTTRAPSTTTVAMLETSSDRRPRERRTAWRSCSRALGCQASTSLTAGSPHGHWRTGTFTVWLSHFFSMASSV